MPGGPQLLIEVRDWHFFAGYLEGQLLLLLRKLIEDGLHAFAGGARRHGGSQDGRRSGGLAVDVGGGFIVAQAEEAGGAQVAVGGPLAELDGGDEFGAHPGDGDVFRAAEAHGARLHDVERRFVRGQRFEALLERRKRAIVEAGADVGGVDEAALVVVLADEERSERPGAAAGAAAEAADDEVVLECGFDLEPALRAAAGFVGAVAALGEDALQAMLDGGAVGGLAVGLEVFEEADGSVGEEELSQQHLAVAEAARAQVVSAGPEQVEDVVVDREFGLHALDLGCAREAEALLDRLERGHAALVKGDDLAVEDHALGLAP